MRAMAHHVLVGGLRRQHDDFRARSGEQSEDVPLDAEIHYDGAPARIVLPPITAVPNPWCFVPGEHLTAAHLLCEVEAFKSGKIFGLRAQTGEVEAPLRVIRDHAMRHA